jgi:hypothetical protein
MIPTKTPLVAIYLDDHDRDRTSAEQPPPLFDTPFAPKIGTHNEAEPLGYSPDDSGEHTDRAGLDELPAGHRPDRASAALTALQDLYAAVDAPSRLSDYGFTPSAIGDAVERVVTAAPASNPVQVLRQRITSLPEHTLLGIPPILETTSLADPTLERRTPREICK